MSDTAQNTPALNASAPGGNAPNASKPNTFVVLHAEGTRAMLGEAVPATEYRAVAVVLADDPSDVFRLTNNIDHAWVENREVAWSQPDARGKRSPMRSTSVGDVIVHLVEDGGEPAVYKIACIGHEKLGGTYFARAMAFRARSTARAHGFLAYES